MRRQNQRNAQPKRLNMDIAVTEVPQLSQLGAALSQQVKTASIDSQDAGPFVHGNDVYFDTRVVNTEINNTMINTFNGSFTAAK